jgi:hypothetical protein
MGTFSCSFSIWFDAAFPERDFVETANDLVSAAPTVSHVETGKCKRAADIDRVEDSEEIDSSDFSTDKEIEAAIPAKPVASRPPPKVKKSRFNNFGLEVSFVAALFCFLIPYMSKSSNDDPSKSLDDQNRFRL